MNAPLFIPWFKAEPVYVPLPFELPILPNGLPIQPFGVLVAIGVLLGIRMGEEFAMRNGIKREASYDFSMWAILPGFAGAYVLNIVFYDPHFFVDVFTNPMNLLRWSGLSSYGGFFGTVFGVTMWHRRHKIPFLNIADTTSFGFPFGWFFGRMGCFVVHDHPGRVTDFFLAVDGYVGAGTPPYPPRHDLGFYEVLWSVGMCILFLVLWRKKRPPGTYLALLCVLYAPIRFGLDFLRAEVDEGGDVRYFGLTPGHYASIVFLLIGLWLLRKILTEPAPEIPTELAEPAPEATAS